MRHTTMACAFCLLAYGVAVQAADATAGQATLADRLAAPEADVIARFKAAGMQETRPHALTPFEQRRAEQALAALPALHRLVLEKKLRRLSFVDGIPGRGSGLTSTVGQTGQFDITLRASLIGESLGEFLSTKDGRLFAPDRSGLVVSFDAPGIDALSYVLLHEASHVVDVALGITADAEAPLFKDIWRDRRTLAPALATSAAARTAYRGAGPIPAGQAAATYEALARTPFVSLYATAAASEDFAELVAWHELSRRFGGGVAIAIRDAGGAVKHRFAPLDFPAVKERMRHVDALLRQADSEEGRQALERRLARVS